MDATGGGAGPHLHRTFSEFFYVLSGSVRLFNGKSHVDAVEVEWAEFYASHDQYMVPERD